jgi:hypothetical protein
MRLTPEQKILVCLLRGAAIWWDDGKLKVAAVAAPLPVEGAEWLKANKADLLKALRPSNEGRLERAIRVGMGPAWLEELRRVEANLEGCGGQERRMKAWALVLGEGSPFEWEATRKEATP